MIMIRTKTFLTQLYDKTLVLRKNVGPSGVTVQVKK